MATWWSNSRCASQRTRDGARRCTTRPAGSEKDEQAEHDPKLYGLAVHRVELPALAEGGFEECRGRGIVDDTHPAGVVFQFAFMAQGDDAEQHPFHERRCHIEVRTGGVAALARTDEIAHVAGR